MTSSDPMTLKLCHDEGNRLRYQARQQRPRRARGRRAWQPPPDTLTGALKAKSSNKPLRFCTATFGCRWSCLGRLDLFGDDFETCEPG